jgi:hypothetical protein
MTGLKKVVPEYINQSQSLPYLVKRSVFVSVLEKALISTFGKPRDFPQREIWPGSFLTLWAFLFSKRRLKMSLA